MPRIKKTKGIYKINDANRKSCWVWERRIGGKRKRTFFSTWEAAVSGKMLAEKEAREAGADLRLIFGGAEQREYRTAKEIVGADVSLVSVALFYRDNIHRIAKTPTKVPDVVKKVLDNIERRDLSDGFTRAAKTYFTRFSEAFADKFIHEISARDIFEWISSLGLGARTQRELSNKVMYLFRRAKSLGMLSELPEMDKSLFPKPAPTPVEVYTLDEMKEILSFITREHPELLANVAIRAFCGLRTREASLLRWEWIDEANKRLLVPSTICKTRDDWILQSPNLPETVFKWLAVVPKSEKTGVVKSAGQMFYHFLHKGLPHIAPRHNGFRHTFCTMHISLHGSADKTATLLKHKGTQMLYAHYLGRLVPEASARAYFELTPTQLP